MRILALDIGEKRIGIAISDALGLFAHPHETLKWSGLDDLISYLIKTIQSKEITDLVIGIPYTLKGSKSKKTEEILKIKNDIAKSVHIPVHEIDERLTTKMASSTLHSLGKKPSKNRNIIDQIAATYILQSYLDKNSKKK